MPITNFVRPNAFVSGYQNLLSCKYLFPSEDISMAAFKPYFISTLFKSYTYFLYFYCIVFKNSTSCSDN